MEKEGKYPSDMMEAERKKNMQIREHLTVEARVLKDRIDNMQDRVVALEEAEQIRQKLAAEFHDPDRKWNMSEKDIRYLLHWLFDGKDEDGRPYGIYITKEGKYSNAEIEYSIHAKIEDLGGGFKNGNHEVHTFSSDKGTLESNDNNSGQNNKTSGSGLCEQYITYSIFSRQRFISLGYGHRFSWRYQAYIILYF